MALVTASSGIFMSALSATSAEGTSGSDRKYASGYQYLRSYNNNNNST